MSMINIVSTKEKEEDPKQNDSVNEEQRQDRIMSFDLLNHSTMNMSVSIPKTDEIKIVELPFQKIQPQNFDWELPSDQWVPDKKAKQCWGCNRDFSIFVWKNHCRKCGRVFCSKCIIERTFDTDGSRILETSDVKQRQKELKFKLREAKICIHCDSTFKSFEQSVSRMKQMNILTALNSSVSQFHMNDIMKQPSQVQQQKLISLRSKSLNKDNNQTQDNLLYETKVIQSARVSEYIKYVEAENIQGIFLNNKLGEQQNRLKEFSHRHIQKIVDYLLIINDLDIRQWRGILYNFVIQAVEQIRPSSRLLNDSMDINDLVKIKIIEWCDNSMSQYINGFVMTKNVADRRMQNQFEKPSILVLKNAIEFEQGDLQTVQDQEEHVIQILHKKLQQIKPQIVIAEKNVTYKILCMLRDQLNITVVSGVDENKLDKISRLTQTVTANGISVVDQKFVLGTCKNFKVTNISKIAKEQGYNYTSSNQNLKEKEINEVNLMTFDGCNPVLGCTILLSGPSQQKSDLK